MQHIKEIWPEPPSMLKKIVSGQEEIEPPAIPKKIKVFNKILDNRTEDAMPNSPTAEDLASSCNLLITANSSTSFAVRSLSHILTDIVEIFTKSGLNCTHIIKPRDINVEVKIIEKLYREANFLIEKLRKREAQERILYLIKKQINKKKNLIKKLNLKEQIASERTDNLIQ